MTLHNNVKSKIIRFLICIYTLWNVEMNRSFLEVKKYNKLYILSKIQLKNRNFESNAENTNDIW